ncbi:uncharacterized protein [Watersipora subatra]|uniref:uncharacterized protein n=1 Tax=Watersipora subatra TaxID=2589382 RepID=UPI00355AECEF
MGSPTFKTKEVHNESATKDNINILGACLVKTKLDSHQHEKQLHFVISKIPNLNLLGRNGIRQLGISVDGLVNQCQPQEIKQIKSDGNLRAACERLTLEFPDFLKKKLGCLKDFELDIRFKKDAQLIFCKARPVRFAIQEDLAQAYDARIARGLLEPVQFNSYGTPVVPIEKALLPGQTKRKL